MPSLAEQSTYEVLIPSKGALNLKFDLFMRLLQVHLLSVIILNTISGGWALDADEADTILVRPLAQLIITTSHVSYAETDDSVEATFHGSLSISGPHVIGPFPTRGETIRINVTLSRYIGTLQYVTMQNRGYNGWLPSRVYCIFDKYEHTLVFPKTWLNSFNYSAYLDEGDGYEPRVQQTSDEINSAELIRFDIQNSIKLNSITGNKPMGHTFNGL